MAEFIVTTLDDETFEGTETPGTPDGAGLSLREALALANGNAEADEITFAAGLAGGTLFLTTGQELAITTDGITVDGDIDGDGDADITIDADSAAGLDDAVSRVFLINGAGSIAATLNGLVIRDGNAGGGGAAGNGGGIYVDHVDALTLTNATVSGNSARRGGGIFGGDDASIVLTNATVSGNSAGFDGGGIYGDFTSSITLTNATVAGNDAGIDGGGIFGGEDASIVPTNATVSGNSAGFDGGGIYGGFTSSITLTNATVAGNDAGDDGGGIFGLSGSSIVLTNATFSGNNAGDNGGGIYGFADNPITLTNSTVTGNSADGDGGGIYNFGDDATTTLANSIVAGNAAAGAGPDLFGAYAGLVFTGGNVIGSAPANFASQTGAPTATIDGTSQAELETVFAAVANNPTTNVLSGVLADNGGAVETIALNPDATNPAIDTGDPNLLDEAQAGRDLNGDGDQLDTIATDARGLARNVGASVDLGAFEAGGILVTTLDDELDAADTDPDTVDFNDISLREALALANGDASANTITFAAALAGGTLFLSQDQHLAITTDGITIDGDIDGDGDADITIDADSAAGLDDATSRVFLIDGAGAVTIAAALNGLVIRDGNPVRLFPANTGGGIFVGQADALTLTNATVSGNNSDNFGGGIYAADNAAITLTNATVSGNSAVYGGGIFGNVFSSITLTNATVSGNSAEDHGGGIYGFADNPITLTNSIVAGNAAANAGDDLFGGNNSTADLAFNGGNVIGSAPANFASQTGAPTAQIDGTVQAELETVFAAVALVDPDGAGVGNDPFFAGVLADNGGAVQTIAIARGGIAQNAGDNAELPADIADLDGDADTAEPLPVDARGLPRVALGTVDVGAFELENAAPVLDATKTPSLDPIVEDAGAPGVGSGTLVSTLVDLSSPAGGLDNVTDDDAGAVTGIALTAVDATNGTWFFTTDGGLNWDSVGAVSDDAALLLAADADTRLYFQPAPDFNGTVAAAITFRAWDQSSGTNGGTADTTPAGGTTAFSTTPDTADITVTAVNDAPVATDDTLSGVAEDSGTRIIPFADLLGNDHDGDPETAQTLTITDVTNAVGGTVLINGTNVEFTPTANFNGPASFDYSVQDDGTTNGAPDAKTDVGAVSFTVTEVNDAPVATDDTLTAVAEDSGTRIIAFADLLGNDADGDPEVTQALTITNVTTRSAAPF